MTFHHKIHKTLLENRLSKARPRVHQAELCESFGVETSAIFCLIDRALCIVVHVHFSIEEQTLSTWDSKIEHQCFRPGTSLCRVDREARVRGVWHKCRSLRKNQRGSFFTAATSPLNAAPIC